jgi:hypothetical protein
MLHHFSDSLGKLPHKSPYLKLLPPKSNALVYVFPRSSSRRDGRCGDRSQQINTCETPSQDYPYNDACP